MESTTDGKVKSSAETNKKKAQRSFKNVLTSPYNQYWSPLQNDKLKTLQECMEKNLPALINLKSRIPWKNLKKLSKEERTKKLNEKKKKIQETESNQPLFKMRSFLTIGLNETSRCLSQDDLSCIVVDGDSKSKRIAIFLVNLAFAKHVPIVICPGFLEQTLTRFGFKTVALGIKKNVANSIETAKKLITLQDVILEMFTKQLLTEPILCPRFKNILEEINKELNSSENDVDMNEDSCDATHEETILESKDNITCGDISLGHTPQVILPDNIYRYRTNKTYRVFVPEKSSTENQAQYTSEGFISVACTEPLKTSRKKEMVSMNKRTKSLKDDLFFVDTGGLVKPPVVKRLKPNPKRVKNS